MEAAETPVDGGHDVDQFGLDAGGGVELSEVGIQENLEVLAGLGGEDDGCRRQIRRASGEPVAEAVAGGSSAAFGGGRAAGLRSVGAGGGGFQRGGDIGRRVFWFG